MNKNNITATINTTITTARVATLIGLGCHGESKVMGKVQKVGEISGRVGTASAAVIGVHAITGNPMHIGVYKALRVAALAGITTGAACSVVSLGYIATKAIQHWANGNAKRIVEAAGKVAKEEEPEGDAGEQPAEA